MHWHVLGRIGRRCYMCCYMPPPAPAGGGSAVFSSFAARSGVALETEVVDEPEQRRHGRRVAVVAGVAGVLRVATLPLPAELVDHLLKLGRLIHAGQCDSTGHLIQGFTPAVMHLQPGG